MAKYTGIPDMVEDYMAESGGIEGWVTVGQLRQRFGFSREQCTGVSRFLRRLHEGTYRTFPYIVVAIQRDPACKPATTPVLQYYIRRRRIARDPVRNVPGAEDCHGAERGCT